MPRITSLRCRRFSPRSGIGEAVVLAVSEDHVVEDSNAEQLADLAQALRELDVLARRRRIAAGVIVLCDAAIYVQRASRGGGKRWLSNPGLAERFT
jgi:hypothetical protein